VATLPARYIPLRPKCEVRGAASSGLALPREKQMESMENAGASGRFHLTNQAAKGRKLWPDGKWKSPSGNPDELYRVQKENGLWLWLAPKVKLVAHLLGERGGFCRRRE